jgi:hypothetical protein
MDVMGLGLSELDLLLVYLLVALLLGAADLESDCDLLIASKISCKIKKINWGGFILLI